MPSTVARQLTSSLDLSEYNVERDKADHGKLSWLENYDMFPYDAPVRQTMSNWSGCISLLSQAIMIWSLISGIVNITGRQFTYSTSVNASHDSNTIALSEWALVVKTNRKSWIDDSYYQWNVRYVTIFESDTNPDKPRQVRNIPMQKCSKVFSPGRAPMAAICPIVASDELITVGKFEDDVYKYVDVALQPCTEPATVPAQDRKCADKALVENALLKSVVGVELWTNSYITPFEQSWVQALFLNTQNSFQGVEAFFERHIATRQNIFRAVDYLNDYMQFHHYLLRVQPIVYNTDGTLPSIFKIYMRATDVRTENSIVQYGFVDFIEQVGGMWSIVSLLLGSMAVHCNRKRYDRNLLDTSKFNKSKNSSDGSSKSGASVEPATTQPAGLAAAVQDWRNEARKEAADKLKVKEVEMKSRKQRRFSTLPLQREEKQEEVADVESEESLRRSMMLNSIGANKKNGSSSDQFITVFKIKELQTMFSAGESAPKLSVPLMRAALSKMMRSFRMLPLTDFEMTETLHEYIREPSAHYLQKKIDVWTGSDKTLRFPSYHELVMRLNDIVRRRFTTRGKVLIMTDGLYCGIDTASLSPKDRNKVCCSLKEVPEKQDIFVENVGNCWYFRNHDGFYLTYPRDNDVAEDIQFTGPMRGDCQKFFLHFDHADPKSGDMLISTASGSPRYITCGASHLQVQPKKNISESEETLPDVEHRTFLMYLYYHDQPLTREDLEAICHITQIHVS